MSNSKWNSNNIPDQSGHIVIVTREKSYRAIIDMGLLDVDQEHVKLRDDKLNIVGASSDMLVIDLGENEDNYKIGDLVEFKLDYMGILRIMNSRYVDKRVKVLAK